MRSISFIASPELRLGELEPVTSTAGNPLYRVNEGAATTQSVWTTFDRGTAAPALVIT